MPLAIVTLCNCTNFSISRFFCCKSQEVVNNNENNRGRGHSRVESASDVYLMEFISEMTERKETDAKPFEYDVTRMSPIQKEFFSIHQFYKDKNNELRFLSISDGFLHPDTIIKDCRITDILDKDSFSILHPIYSAALQSNRLPKYFIISNHVLSLYIHTDIDRYGLGTMTIVPDTVINCEQMKHDTLRKRSEAKVVSIIPLSSQKMD